MPINLEDLKQFLGTDEEFIATLIGKFEQEIPKEGEKLFSSAKEADWKKVRAISHKMLSSTKIFNLEELTLVLQQIEKNSEAKINLEKMPELMEKFELSSKKALNEMKELKERIGK